MARAVPGDKVWGGLRQGSLSKFQVSIRNPDGYLWHYPCSIRMESALHLVKKRENCWFTFTLLFSGLWVERDRLGEVVSLVGDCRPPPPGNPRRPARLRSDHSRQGGWWSNKVFAAIGDGVFTARMGKHGGKHTFEEVSSSLYRHQLYRNLKELNQLQYFKNNRSYFSCRRGNPVLKFEHLHSHLCGLKVVEPPPIAITNVLRTR